MRSGLTGSEIYFAFGRKYIQAGDAEMFRNSSRNMRKVDYVVLFCIFCIIGTLRKRIHIDHGRQTICCYVQQF